MRYYDPTSRIVLSSPLPGLTGLAIRALPWPDNHWIQGLPRAAARVREKRVESQRKNWSLITAYLNIKLFPHENS